MQSMQQQFSQDVQSVESPQDDNGPMESYSDNQGSPKALPELRLYRSPNRKPNMHQRIGSLFDGGIDLKEERRRAEERYNKYWAPHAHPKTSMTAQASYSAGRLQRQASSNIFEESAPVFVAPKALAMPKIDSTSAFAAPTPLAMNTEVQNTDGFAAPTPLAMNTQMNNGGFTAPTPLAMNTQVSNAADFAAPTPLAMNAQASDSTRIQDPAFTAEGMLNTMRSEVNNAASEIVAAPVRRHEGNWGNVGEQRRSSGGHDPIMHKLADVQRKLLALHHRKDPKVRVKASPLIPDEGVEPDRPADEDTLPPPPQPSQAQPPHHHNRLWDAPPPPAAPTSSTRISMPTPKNFVKAPAQVKKPPVHALLSHNVNQDTTTSTDSLFFWKDFHSRTTYSERISGRH